MLELVRKNKTKGLRKYFFSPKVAKQKKEKKGFYYFSKDFITRLKRPFHQNELVAYWISRVIVS